jgi:hypothetical protein
VDGIKEGRSFERLFLFVKVAVELRRPIQLNPSTDGHLQVLVLEDARQCLGFNFGAIE